MIALLLENHDFHPAMMRWFASNLKSGWATCPLTQLGFVRIATNPAYVKPAPKIATALNLLQATIEASVHHEFWADNLGLSNLNPAVKSRLTGHKQLTDAYLISIAIKNGGRLVSFDRRILQLAPDGSEERDALEILR